MNHNLIASICFIVACALIASVTQNAWAFMCLAVAIMLFGFILWLDRKRIDKADEIQNQIETIKNRLEAIQLHRIIK
jgi:Flp pilus assembly protein TadB